MKPFRLVRAEENGYSLLLTAGDAPVEDVVASLGHEPNGYFWEGVAVYLLHREKMDEVTAGIEFDPEADMFCAYSRDRAALERLGGLMAPVVREPQRIRELLAEAQAQGFEFDD